MKRLAPCPAEFKVAAWILASCVASASVAATPPAGFEDHLVMDGTAATGALSSVGVAYEPGSGALFVLEKGDGTGKGTARVRRKDPVSGAVTTALTLTCVGSTGEQGLLGIAFDPDYLAAGGANRYVYLFYTRAAGQSGTSCEIAGLPWGWYNQVVRLHESGGQLTGEQLLLRGTLLVANNHDGGTVAFAPDKTLYISMGDNDTDADTPPAARNLNDLRGKILRINRDGTIPSNNPFVGQTGKRAEIWAWGLRNPFRISIDPATGNVFIADVGEASWEEIDAGIAGADYGWPCFEANAAFRSCFPPASGDVKPIYAYGHNGQTPPVEGDSVIGGPVYRGTAFPPEYVGQYFFGDYGGNWIRRATVAANGMLTAPTMFLPDATSVVDMTVSPAGCLTWVSIGGLGVHDTCYLGGSNGQPQARSTAAPVSGLAPLLVQFDGRSSTDPDQDPLTYSWAFGDSTSSVAAAPQKTYSTNGVRQAVLTVDDGTGTPNATDVASPLRIVVGNRAPTGTITTPPAGSHYSAGATVSYAGSGTDPEDGSLPASAFSWMIVFHHTDHTHPFLGPITGVKSGSFTIPTSGEDSTEVFYRIELTVTDSGMPLGSTGSLSHDSYVDVLPNVTTVTVAASPSGAGLSLSIDQTPGIAPWSKATVAAFPRTLTAAPSQVVRGATWSFQTWSDGGAAEHVVAPPIAPATYTATYKCVSGCAFTPALRVDRVVPDTARLSWGALTCALSYDVVRGNLSMLKSSSGNFAMSTIACVADDTAAITRDDPTITPVSGLWYLVRGNGCGGSGSYDEIGVLSQVGSRDAEIGASGSACP